MAYLASTDVSLTVNPEDRNILGKIKMNFVNAAFGDGAKTYPHGGIEVPAVGNWGLNKVISAMEILSPPAEGFTFKYDKTNSKIKIYAPAPPVIFEELIDCDADLAYTKYPAAFIISVASADIRHDVVSGAKTPATGQVAVSLYASLPGTRAKLVFPSGEGAAATYVTYITQAWKDVFDNLVEDEDPTYGTNVFTLSSLAVGIQNTTWDDDGTVKACIPQYKGETATGSELEVDFSEGDPLKTTLTMAAGFSEADDEMAVTFIKKPAAGFLVDRFIEEDDLTPSSDICTVSSGGNLSNMLLYGTMGCFSGAAGEYAEILRSAATLGATATNSKMSNSLWIAGYGADTFTLGSDHADTAHLKPSYIWGNPGEIAPLEPLEIPDGTVIQATSLDALVWGK